jgi:hypothetical protein
MELAVYPDQQMNQPDLKVETGKEVTHRLYGLTLRSDFPFANQLLPTAGVPDLHFTCVETAPILDDWQQSPPIFTSRTLTETGESSYSLYHQPDYEVLHFADTADYYLWNDKIICHLFNSAYDYWVEIGLLGSVFSFWLERRGILALHASSVVLENGAIAFLASNKGGKSSLAATFMQSGYSLLTDDILPVELNNSRIMGRPGYPQMRMWPDQAQHFLGHYQTLARVHPELSKRRVPVGQAGLGTFCDVAQLLNCLYIPERRDPQEWGMGIEIIPISPREVILELMHHAFAAQVIDAVVSLRPQRFNLLAQIAQQVPMRRLIYPAGLEHLPLVRDAILADCRC